MTQQFLKGRRIGLSVSDSINLAQLGLGKEHVEDNLVEMTRYIIALGATVVYGGDLRQNGFTDLLLEVIARHQLLDETSVKFENFLAWPVHANLSFDSLTEITRLFEPAGRLILLSENGDEISLGERSKFDRLDVSDNSWRPALTAMRIVLAERCDARIIAGGATTVFRGAMPGVAEEALLSIEAGKPTFVVGALGGCALDIGLRCGLASSPVSFSADWKGQERFDNIAEYLNPGLSPEEAASLASTNLGTDVLVLLLRGLHSTFQEHEPTKTLNLD